MSSRKRGEVKYGSSVQYSASVERLHTVSQNKLIAKQTYKLLSHFIIVPVSIIFSFNTPISISFSLYSPFLSILLLFIFTFLFIFQISLNSYYCGALQLYPPLSLSCHIHNKTPHIRPYPQYTNPYDKDMNSISP